MLSCNHHEIQLSTSKKVKKENSIRDCKVFRPKSSRSRSQLPAPSSPRGSEQSVDMYSPIRELESVANEDRLTIHKTRGCVNSSTVC